VDSRKFLQHAGVLGSLVLETEVAYQTPLLVSVETEEHGNSKQLGYGVEPTVRYCTVRKEISLLLCMYSYMAAVWGGGRVGGGGGA
jgi:hypothetical protein